jgi:hypothetical protein
MFKYAHFVFGAALTIGAAAANAGDLPSDAAEAFMDACRPDYHRLCAYVVPGEGRAARCLLDRETELSPRCLRAVKLAFAIEACLPDYDRYCRGVPRGPQAVACLSSRLDILHPECRRVVAANEPYLREPEGGRFAYRSGPYNAPGEAPYGYEGRAPYGGAYREPEPYEQRDREAAGEGPRYQPYGADPYSAPSQGYDRYAYGPGPQNGERYAGDGEPRFQRYGERYPSSGYDEPSYQGAPQGPYAGEEREPPR